MTTWFLRTDVAEAMRDARAAGASLEPTEDERREFAAAVREAYASKDADRPRNMKVEGTRAEISVYGVLTEQPDCFAQLFGGGNTTYASIRKAIAQAEENPDVKETILDVNSPGGSVDGLFATLDVLATAKKPIRVRATLAASAAYAIAAVAGPIEATGLAAEFGSIGVAARIQLPKDVVNVASTEAPNKRPDLTTDEGKAVVREELDALHGLFADYIARGRSRTTESEVAVSDVNANFGRGGVMLAKDAKKRGMIDSLPKPVAWASRSKNANSTAELGGAEPQGKRMNKEQLKAQHPEVYSAVHEEGRVAGLAAGVAEGESKERKRVLAHLKLEEATGATKVARDAITSGASTMDEEIHAAYLAAGMTRNKVEARQADSDSAGAAVDGAKPAASVAASGDMGDQIADKLFGKKESK